MTTTLAMREAIVSAIAAKIPTLRTCRAQHVKLDDAELDQVYHAAPAVLVVFLGADGIRREATLKVPHERWAAFVLTAGPVPEKRNDQAIAIVDTLAVLVSGNRWGIESAREPERFRSEPVSDAKLTGKGVTLWAAIWYQGIELDSTVDVATLDQFLTLQATFDVNRDGVVDPADPVAVTEAHMEAP